ncbi:RdgB/HAM1 family non-canonical purine NTP pyrophosphatase [Cohnella soli]|uniref:dITP/XTP pyrophosphatase n=1 Tax=Cohnella soli TaxID=425005 RepID=A0ABW0HNJ9_9BACL
MIGSGTTVLVATRNRGKSKEFAEAFGKLGIAVKDLHDVEGVPDIEETGTTFAENAFLKAKETADIVGIPVLADDSGLCVDELGGAPGVYSARYAGEGAKDADNNAKLLRELLQLKGAGSAAETGGGPETLSAARFKCALVLYDPADGSRIDAEGFVEGAILREARGEGGFGYDPLFWLASHGKSMAELTPAEKNAISHRGKALRALLSLIQ